MAELLSALAPRMVLVGVVVFAFLEALKRGLGPVAETRTFKILLPLLPLLLGPLIGLLAFPSEGFRIGDRLLAGVVSGQFAAPLYQSGKRAIDVVFAKGAPS